MYIVASCWKIIDIVKLTLILMINEVKVKNDLLTHYVISPSFFLSLLPLP
jgi:hypothetical protein